MRTAVKVGIGIGVLLLLGGGIALYFVLRKKSSGGDSVFSWQAAPWPSEEQCPKCGGCLQSRKVECVRDGITVSPDNCNSSEKPEETRTINTDPCEWIVGEWGSCSQSCGGGVQTRTVSCPREESFCKGEKPASEQPCNTQDCQWVVGAWDTCKTGTGEIVSCGRDSKRKRTVSCPREESFCKGEKPALEEVCTDLPFCTWKIGEWSPQ